MSWRKHFRSVDLNREPSKPKPSGYSTSHTRYSSWLPEVYAGSPNRLMRYIQYNQMDQDAEINAALDIIAEFCTQEDEHSGLPFEVDYFDTPGETENEIITDLLKKWCKINDINRKLFSMVRNTIKYGDQVFIRDPETHKIYWTDIANVDKAIVNESKGKEIEQYHIRNLEFNFQELAATSAAPIHSRPYGQGQGLTNTYSPVGTTVSNYVTGSSGESGVDQGVPIDAKHVIHVSLSDGMDHNWPFGISILEPVFKIFKQKELLEDSIIIYRVHRAPERRVFFIDVGDMPPQRAQQYLERIKYEVQQKRVPNKNKDGQNVADAAYNPMSMLEDYFFAQTADGRGSKVDTLPGGENLGQIDDLKYFNNRLVRGLRVPSSYLPTGPDDGTQPYNDGKVGVAYIQEYQFSKYCERIQRQIIRTLDEEFKKYLKFKGAELDDDMFELRFTPPQNFSSYRELDMDSARAGLLQSVDGFAYLSNQFKLKRYLGLTDAEMQENEKLWRAENSYEMKQDKDTELGLQSVGVAPAPGSMVSPELDMDMEIPGEEMGGEEMGGETPAEPTAPEGGAEV